MLLRKEGGVMFLKTKIALKLKAWVYNFFVPRNDKEADIRGEDSEARVYKVLQEMLIWKELPTRKSGTRPYRTEKWSALDRQGVDIVVPTKRGDIHVQVKSSYTGFRKFVKDERNRHIVCVNGQLSEKVLQTELGIKLRIAYERLGDRT